MALMGRLERWDMDGSDGGSLARMGEIEVMADGTSGPVACPGR